MSEEKEKEPSSIIGEIEKQLEKVLLRRREEIEREFEERIRIARDEVNEKLNQIEKDVIREKEVLRRYRIVMEELDRRRADLQNQIKEHLNRALDYQKEIERLTGLTMEELKQVSELNREIEEIRQIADEKYEHLRKSLEEKFGISAELREEKEEEVKVDLNRELTKLKKIKELLESGETGKEGETPQEEKESKAQAPGEELHAGEEPLTAEEEKEKRDFQSVFEALEKFRKSEVDEDNMEISYFQSEAKTILDAESVIVAIGKTLEEAKALYNELEQKESLKEQFFIKQEILNHQEFLRKFILRGIRLCEKDNCFLPSFTSEIINCQTLKDILEKLSMGNWSNQEQFVAFDTFVARLKDAFYTKITPPYYYLKSILEELKN